VTRPFLFCALLSLHAAAATAQAPAATQTPAAAPAPAAAPEKPAATQPVEPRRPLILRLDEIDGPKPSFGASEGEKYQGRELPSLGGDARKVEGGGIPRSSPYPHSSENLQ
jgi:hypothetical protein